MGDVKGVELNCFSRLGQPLVEPSQPECWASHAEGTAYFWAS